MERKLKNISKLLIVTGCVSVLAYNMATAAPLVYDMGQPAIRADYSTPNKINLTGNVEFDDNGQLINLSLRNTDVQQVLRMFADKAGLNIVFHQSAVGNVTLDLVDVRLEDAFKMVMKMTNLTYVIKDKTMLVVATDKAETINLTKDSIAILPVKYADAAYLAQFLNTNVFGMNTPGLSFGPIVSTNADANELLIFGTENDYQMAKKIVDKFDKKPVMTTFRVNHTTPFEMAKMICQTLFQLPFEGNVDGAGNGSYSSNKVSSETFGDRKNHVMTPSVTLNGDLYWEQDNFTCGFDTNFRDKMYADISNMHTVPYLWTLNFHGAYREGNVEIGLSVCLL